MTPSAPQLHGTWDERFDRVAEAFAANFVEHGELGAAVHVSIDGEEVVDVWAGHADAARTRDWAADTLVDVYSVGKAFAATAVLLLVDDGRLGLDDPVALHWPDFGQAGKDRVTVRQVLCHRAGLPAIREPLTDDDLFDLDAMLGAIERTAPWWEPGTRHAYHTNTFGHLTGGLVRAVTGTSPGRWIREVVAGPAGADVHVGVPDEDLRRCAEVVWDGPVLSWSHDQMTALDDVEAQMVALGYANPPGYSSMGVVNSTAWRRSEIPSTNTHATARGVASVYDALLAGRLLSAGVLAEATSPQSQGWCPVLEQDVTFGLGFQPWTPHRPLGRTPGSYGHFGTGGALGFADPVHRVAFGYVMNHVVPRWQSPRNRALVDAVYASLP